VEQYLIKKYGPTMTKAEVADFFKVHPWTVTRWISSEYGFPSGVIHRGKRLFLTEEIGCYFKSLDSKEAPECASS
jgi:hypothetical protein